jgi:hypothetical protein
MVKGVQLRGSSSWMSRFSLVEPVATGDALASREVEVSKNN